MLDFEILRSSNSFNGLFVYSSSYSCCDGDKGLRFPFFALYGVS